jgi:phage terminase small subunit
MVIEVVQGADADGTPTLVRKTKFLDRQVALDKLARHLGMFNDKIKISGDAENPLMMLIMKIQGSSIKPVIEEHDRAA